MTQVDQAIDSARQKLVFRTIISCKQPTRLYQKIVLIWHGYFCDRHVISDKIRSQLPRSRRLLFQLYARTSRVLWVLFIAPLFRIVNSVSVKLQSSNSKNLQRWYCVVGHVESWRMANSVVDYIPPKIFSKIHSKLRILTKEHSINGHNERNFTERRTKELSKDLQNPLDSSMKHNHRSQTCVHKNGLLLTWTNASIQKPTVCEVRNKAFLGLHKYVF